jgi:hypothetical protein
MGLREHRPVSILSWLANVKKAADQSSRSAPPLARKLGCKPRGTRDEQPGLSRIG